MVAARRGITTRRLRAPDLVPPFAGARATEAPRTVAELARASAPLGAEGEFFSHTTAAILHGMRLPLALENEMVLHVSVRRPHEPRIDLRISGAHGRFIGEGDLPYPEHMVLVEYEVDGHRERGQFRKDIGRVDDFADAGWRVIHATGHDLIDPTHEIAVIRRALGM